MQWGLTSWNQSPRVLTPQRATALAAASDVPVVILTMDLGASALLETIERVGADGAQPYGAYAEEAAEAARAAGKLVLRPIRVRGSVELGRIRDGIIPLLDGYTPEAMGGTGTPVPPEWLPRARESLCPRRRPRTRQRGRCDLAIPSVGSGRIFWPRVFSRRQGSGSDPGLCEGSAKQ